MDKAKSQIDLDENPPGAQPRPALIVPAISHLRVDPHFRPRRSGNIHHSLSHAEYTIQNPMRANTSASIVKQLRRIADPEEHRAIRQLWIDHSIAEDSHDIPGLMATLTEDCVYTIANHNVSWHGQDGATRFYQQLLTAFPDIHFDLQQIVIGPQGVFEEAHVTGTYQSQWLDMPPPAGESIEFDVIILFPWDPERKLFTGERIYFFNIGLVSSAT
jgi:predicted ester cyclase